MKVDVAVVGGGFYGCNIASFYASQGKSVVLIEQHSELITRASSANQARIHAGYHYPRSIVTALRSKMLYEKFMHDFPECIYSDFDMYYVIGKHFSKITTHQFVSFCKLIDLSLEKVEKNVNDMIDYRFVENIFKVKEYAFDYIKIRQLMQEKLDVKNVKILYNHKVVSLEKNGSDLSLLLDGKHIRNVMAKNIFNCTYSGLNSFHKSSGISVIPLKKEMVEIALISAPSILAKKGFTIMCGPFFSTMPYPAENLHSLLHVRYGNHHTWLESDDSIVSNDIKFNNNSNYKSMLLDAIRYIPCLEEAKYVRSIKDIRVKLPLNEKDDGRPIMLNVNFGLEGYHCILGGKLDNIYDVMSILKKQSVVF
ncbi:MAG: FAD-dependent oxidoreductase [Pseudobdellovibrio sp.]